MAGAGGTGKHVVEELVATRTPFVVIDRSEHVLQHLSEDLCGGKMLHVHGDATLDHVLLAAGVARARGVVAALTHDKDNLYVTLSARSLNAARAHRQQGGRGRGGRQDPQGRAPRPS